MKEMVVTELNYMARVFTQNLKTLNLAPDVRDTGYYVLEELTQNTNLTLNSALNPDGSFNVESDLPTIPWFENDEVEDPYYTFGGEFVIEEDRGSTEFGYGDEYIGYYHVHVDEETGQAIYMTGEDHVEAPHDVLSPMANIQRVPIGDVGDVDAAPEFEDDKPFLLEKYMKIDGVIYSFNDGMSIISSQDQSKLVSEVYPGTLSLVEDVEGNPVGLEGELGIRYGLRFSMIPEESSPGLAADRFEIVNVEIDALDTTLREVKRVDANSKLLVCLINHLKEDEKFRLITRYIFPMPKLLSVAAMYNDLGMLPSIGELTVDDGDAYSIFGFGGSVEAKPGYQALPSTETVINADGQEVEVIKEVNVGPISKINNGVSQSDADETQVSELGTWASFKDRTGFGKSPFFLDWDQWDQILLRNSTSRIKKLFKSYYYSRDFADPDEAESPGTEAIMRFREALKRAPGRQLVPWWMRRLLRTNPFNAEGGICKNDDSV